MDKIGKVTKALGYLDYAVSIACLAYGAYTQTWLYVAFGLAGLVVAYINPAKQVKRLIQDRFMRKRHAPLTSVRTGIAKFTATVLESYQPRSRYTGYSYYVGFGATRIRAANPGDLSSIRMSLTSRFSAGVRPKSIVLKKRIEG